MEMVNHRLDDPVLWHIGRDGLGIERCWVHKTAKVLNRLPNSLQPKAKDKLQQIWMTPNKAETQTHFDEFISIYEAKHPKATQCLKKDRDRLLTFYNSPDEHWWHIRTTKPIESTVETVRLRTAKVRSCFSSKMVVTMAFKLCQSAQKRWQRLYGYRKLGKVIRGVKFVNGIEKVRNTA
jgi:putative transposase